MKSTDIIYSDSALPCSACIHNISSEDLKKIVDCKLLIKENDLFSIEFNHNSEVEFLDYDNEPMKGTSTIVVYETGSFVKFHEKYTNDKYELMIL